MIVDLSYGGDDSTITGVYKRKPYTLVLPSLDYLIQVISSTERPKLTKVDVKICVKYVHFS